MSTTTIHAHVLSILDGVTQPPSPYHEYRKAENLLVEEIFVERKNIMHVLFSMNLKFLLRIKNTGAPNKYKPLQILSILTFCKKLLRSDSARYLVWRCVPSLHCSSLFMSANNQPALVIILCAPCQQWCLLVMNYLIIKLALFY